VGARNSHPAVQTGLQTFFKVLVALTMTLVEQVPQERTLQGVRLVALVPVAWKRMVRPMLLPGVLTLGQVEPLVQEGRLPGVLVEPLVQQDQLPGVLALEVVEVVVFLDLAGSPAQQELPGVLVEPHLTVDSMPGMLALAPPWDRTTAREINLCSVPSQVP
jgi:hypothetical protein